MQTGTSSAFCAFYNKRLIKTYQVKLHNLNTIYQAEQTALLEAIKWIKTTNYRRISIYSDSFSAIQSLRRSFPNNDLEYEIHKTLYELEDKEILFGWVKAHIGNIGNEQADNLAKDVIEKEKFDEERTLLFPISAIRTHYKKAIICQWQELWNTTEKGRDTFNVFNRVNENYVCSSQIIAYYITGHGSFPKHLYTIGKLDSSLCACGKEGDVKHYLFGNCQMMKNKFKFNRNWTLRKNMQNILLNSNNYNALKENYNILNDKYSFIKQHF